MRLTEVGVSVYHINGGEVRFENSGWANIYTSHGQPALD